MDSRKNSTSIWGTKPSTAPTPATMPSMIRPYSQPATPMLSKKPPSAFGTISPNSTSLVQSVAKVPMAQPPSAMEVPMDREYIRYITTAKMGSASTRLVTIRSILSETVRCSTRAFFLTALPTTVLM